MKYDNSEDFILKDREVLFTKDGVIVYVSLADFVFLTNKWSNYKVSENPNIVSDSNPRGQAAHWTVNDLTIMLSIR